MQHGEECDYPHGFGVEFFRLSEERVTIMVITARVRNSAEKITDKLIVFTFMINLDESVYLHLIYGDQMGSSCAWP